jgi:quercetin dioxygenase-like cupin family protein
MEHTGITPSAKAPAQAFTGDVYVTMLQTPKETSKLVASLVRFTPEARTNWHSHKVGQTLYCTEGEGLVVNRDGQVIRLRAGDTVWTPPGEEHWHGGTGTSCMSHVAMLEVDDNGDNTDWLEPVTDEQYRSTRPGLT